jgi:membrane-associated phospholipid phosphatase
MARPLFTVLTALFACAALAASGAGAQTLPSSPKPAPTLLALRAGEIDPARILPPPPADGSPQALAELAELHDIQASRSAERLAQARWDGEHEDVSAFVQAIGPGFDLKVLPETAKLLAIVQNDQHVVASQAKKHFLRRRPYVVDTTLQGCEKGGGKPLTSYPSGHATLAYSLTPVLIDLMPDKAAAIAARADDYVYSRLICEVHFRSDIRAGQILGAWVAADLMADPAFAAQFAAARRELVSAHLTRP